MKLLKASQEFIVGKHQIGWVDPDFTREFSNTSLLKENYYRHLNSQEI